ncbi:MAG: PIN domain-containing protein [Chitinivibrionales bacterium]|nr:PIN domain-containing protein [Chitinivibrionales bacterium]
MNLVDSSGWLAFFADTQNAGEFSKAIEDLTSLLVPTIVMYEVTKVLLRERGEGAAILGQAHLQQGTVVDLDTEIAVNAANLSLHHRLPMADSIILATAQAHEATVWTQDDNFEGLPNVRYFAVG